MRPGLPLITLAAVLAVLSFGCGRQLVTNERAEGTTTLQIASDPKLVTASNRYRDYVNQQTADLARKTDQFTSAVEEGDLKSAKELYASTRVPWESIEPVAEKLGNYDPEIDAREGDVPDDEWTGFHRIEKSLWVNDTTDGQAKYARELKKDVDDLKGEVEDLKVEPVDLVAGSVGLLNEVSASKITGEEERYSHTDLYDFEANLDGSRKAFELLAPSLKERDPELVQEIRTRFDAVYSALKPYRRGDGWVSYEKVSKGERRELSQRLDALAEPLSRMGKVLEEK